MHISLAYPSLPRGNEYEDVISAINGVMGGSMSSRLFQEVREKRGLAYSVYSYISSYAECGLQVIYAGVNPEQKIQAYEAIENVVRELKEKGVSQEEFNRSREQMKSGMLFAQESSNSQMLLYGKYMLYFDRVFDFEKKLNDINAMTLEDAKLVLENMFDESQKAIALVGNTKEAF